MTDKQTIEYVRPEGLPEDAVPFVAFVGVADERGFFPTYHPNGETWSLFTEHLLRKRNLPVPERIYEATLQLTKGEVEYLAGAPMDKRDLPVASVYRKAIDAAKAVLAAIEAGEA